jgi:MIP family channel proteins
MDDSRLELATPTGADIQQDYYNNNNHYNNNNDYTYKLIKTFISESFGMYIFILMSLGNIATFVLYPESKLSWDGIAISWGLNLMFGIYIASFNSDAHLNPAISLCMYIYKSSITLLELLIYTFAQLFGSFLAASTVYGIYSDKLGSDDGYSGVFVTYKHQTISLTAAFFTEFLGTALLAGGIFMICDHVNTKKNIPVYIGLLLSALVYSFGCPTAFAWNPARDFGPRILTAIVGYNSFSYMDYYWWVPIVAPYFGSIFGVFLYKTLNQT